MKKTKDRLKNKGRVRKQNWCSPVREKRLPLRGWRGSPRKVFEGSRPCLGEELPQGDRQAWKRYPFIFLRRGEVKKKLGERQAAGMDAGTLSHGGGSEESQLEKRRYTEQKAKATKKRWTLGKTSLLRVGSR